MPRLMPPSLVRVRSRRRAVVPTSVSPSLSIVIVNYRQWENTAALVRQIVTTPAARAGAVEVVVVDNHSPAHPLARRLRHWPGVSLRRWGRNRGFARAVNEGCRLSRGAWLLLLNPDVTLADGFLDGVLALAEELSRTAPRVGIVGFQLRNSDGSEQMSAGDCPTLASTLTGLFLPRSRRKYRSLREHQRCEVPWVTGCCVLIRHDCLRELGGLDESFFLYYEDVDLCRRAWANGWATWYEPALRATHHQPLHQRTVSSGLRMITRHSLLTYAMHHWPRWQARLLSAIVGVEATARRLWARWRGDEAAAGIFDQMAAMVRDFRRGDTAAARQRLNRVVRAGDPRV